MKKAQFALILLASILSCVLAASALFRDFNATTLATAVGLERYTQTCASLICDLALHGRLYLEQDARMDADLFASLREDKAAGTYSLDALLGTERAQHVGNLTGIGTLPASGPLRRELNLALQYNTFFEMYHRDHPEIVWLYYTSQNRFISAYPFTPSREFSYSDELRGVAFYDVAIPANNPRRIRRQACRFNERVVHPDHRGRTRSRHR